MFYGGMVRRKNVLSTLMQSFILVAIVSIQWMLFGYSLAFSPGSDVHRRPCVGGSQWRQHGASRMARLIRRPCLISVQEFGGAVASSGRSLTAALDGRCGNGRS